jgi:hypothetical protein
MINDTDKTMIFKFLYRHYPVTRVKYNMRFKRGITLDNGLDYVFSDENQLREIKFQLITTIMTIFYCSDVTAKNMVINYLNLK